MPRGPEALTDAALAFLGDRHLASLTTLRADGTPHVTPVGFTYDAGTRLARVICGGGSQKAANVRRGSPAALCQVDGARWLTLEGVAHVETEPPAVHDAEQRYAHRYRPPRPNPTRVVLVVAVARVLGSAAFLTA